MQTSRWFLLSISIIGMVMLAGCGLSDTHSITEHASQSNFSAPHTDIQLDEIEVDEHQTAITFHISAETTAGAIAWQLTNPNGNVWNGVVEGEQNAWTHDLDAVAGVWLLEITFEDAVGGYEMKFQTED